MSWEQPEDRHGRTAVFFLVAAILLAAALAIALVSGAASQSSRSSDEVTVSAPVTDDTSVGTSAGTASDASDVVSAVGPVAVATVSVPAIRLEALLHEGLAGDVLDQGLGHWPGTAAPGGFGNLVIAGHRSTGGSLLERIGELVPGDAIVVGDVTGRYTYVVDSSEVVIDAVGTAGEVSAQTPGHTMTLIAPHPPGTEDHRYVVRARLLSPPRAPGV